MPASTVYLLRHGRTALNAAGALRGLIDVPLDQVGETEAVRLGDLFASTATHLFTHYQREEDRTMERGKLDEELYRMSQIVDQLRPGCLVLFNESFASTTEREGSQIAHGIVRALLESGVRVAYVTHMYDLAQRLVSERAEGGLFLRAERRDDGRRTFRLVEGDPLPTSFGRDLYDRIFGEDPRTAVGAGIDPQPCLRSR